MSKNKHYSEIEKKIFLEILKDVKHVIETKKSDSSTLREKEVAWSEVCKRYNESPMIFCERTVTQLKKLWANMKQNQRDILTKEKQARLATGGGPPPPEVTPDPDIAAIAPHLLQTAPVIFTSNMTENEINEKAEHVLNIPLDDNEAIMLLEDSNNEIKNKIKAIQKDDETSDKENQTININEESFGKKKKHLIVREDTAYTQTKKIKRSGKNVENFVGDEDALKIERIKQIMEDEKEMAEIRKRHEKKIAEIKENYYKELYNVEIRAALAKAELAELQLKKEKEN